MPPPGHFAKCLSLPSARSPKTLSYELDIYTLTQGLSSVVVHATGFGNVYFISGVNYSTCGILPPNFEGIYL